jgi:hypothetical protein
MTLEDGIRAIYAQVDAPAWAAPNLDALVDVLRDLGWLPERGVEIVVPEVDAPEGARFYAAVRHAVADSADGPRPVRIRT